MNLKDRVSVKINLIAIQIAHAHLYYVHKKYSRFQNDSLEIVGEVNYTNSISFNANRSDYVQKAVILSKLILSPPKLHMHNFIISTKSIPVQGFKRPIENCGKS